MERYITNGVLIGLHYHKVGQYRSLCGVTIGLAGLLVVVVVASLFVSPGGVDMGKPVVSYRSVVLPPGGMSGGSTSSDSFFHGYIGGYALVRNSNHGGQCAPSVKPSESILLPAPGVFESIEPFGPGGLDDFGDSFFGDGDIEYGLPASPPMWTFTSRGLPRGTADRFDLSLDSRGHAMLINPTWPDDVWLVDDTAVVEGLLTLHSYGLMSFELISETPDRHGFALAVKRAIEQSQCIPAKDASGDRITVQCRYRVLFFHDGKPSVSVGTAVTARVAERSKHVGGK